MRDAVRVLGARDDGFHGLAGVQAGLLHECLPRDAFADPARLAAAIKALPVTLWRPRPVAEAISTAGGVTLESLDDALMLRARPGVFCAGELLDWEAPTGGYLLQACFASGRRAGLGAVRWLAAQGVSTKSCSVMSNTSGPVGAPGVGSAS